MISSLDNCHMALLKNRFFSQSLRYGKAYREFP
jgi:hypothetical protein